VQWHERCTVLHSADHSRCSWWCLRHTRGCGRPAPSQWPSMTLHWHSWPSWLSPDCPHSVWSSARAQGCRDLRRVSFVESQLITYYMVWNKNFRDTYLSCIVQAGLQHSHIDYLELLQWKWTAVHRAKQPLWLCHLFGKMWYIPGLQWLSPHRLMPPQPQTSPTQLSHCYTIQWLTGQQVGRVLKIEGFLLLSYLIHDVDLLVHDWKNI